jgi:hypothetical protein
MSKFTPLEWTVLILLVMSGVLVPYLLAVIPILAIYFQTSKRQFYIDHLNSDQWKDLRYLALIRDNFTCQDCNRKVTSDTAHCHHLTYSNLGSENLSDVVILCRSCHIERHSD